MGIFDDIGDFFSSAGDFIVDVGGEAVQAVVDFNDWTVNLEDELWSEVPTDFFPAGLQPLIGLLKRQIDDGLLMLVSPEGLLTGLAAFPVEFDAAADVALSILTFAGVIKHRGLHDDEWNMANWTFGGQLPTREKIRLTNLGVPDGGWNFNRAITFPAISGQFYINLGKHYRDKTTIADGPLLLHEMTHVWQCRNKAIPYMQIVAALNRTYDYTYGKQWSDYGIEQQATIVQDWANGSIEMGGRKIAATGDVISSDPLSVGSPLFRYLYHNLRRNNDGALSLRAKSLRQLTGSHGSLRLSTVVSRVPQRWWSPGTSL